MDRLCCQPVKTNVHEILGKVPSSKATDARTPLGGVPMSKLLQTPTVLEEEEEEEEKNEEKEQKAVHDPVDATLASTPTSRKGKAKKKRGKPRYVYCVHCTVDLVQNDLSIVK